MTVKENSRLALVTGDVEVGKTTAVGRVVALARARGYVCGGLWAPAHVIDGEKTGIEVVDLASDEHRLLAWMSAVGAGKRMGRYTFDPAVIAWANHVLARAIAARPDLLVVDEIGPLELERGGGLAPALESLAAGGMPRLLVVVRAWLLDALRARLPAGRVAVFAVDVGTRGLVPGRVVNWLFGR